MHGSPWVVQSLSRLVANPPSEFTCEHVIDLFADNGGPAGVLYELLVACFYYAFIAASIAEVRTHVRSC